MFSIAHHA